MNASHRRPSSLRFTIQNSRLNSAILFIVVLALYLRTACPTLGGGWDSEEFQHVAYTLGIAHSTGYPLYLILGKIFTTLVPISNIAYRMNLLSVILTAFAVVFVYLNTHLLTQRQLTAIATAALFATNPAVWRQAGVASVGPLNLLLLSALVYALLLWHAGRAPLTIAAFVFGLSLAHHRTILFLAPAIALFVWLGDPGIVRRPRDWALALFWLALPLGLYLYIPIFGSAPPWYVNTPQGFLNHIAGSEAGNYARGNLLDLGQAFVAILQYLSDSFGIVGIALIGIGAARALPQFNHAKTALNDSRVKLFLGLGVLTYIGFATFVTGEPDRYLVLPFAFLIYWFALGASAIENMSLQGAFFATKQSPTRGLGIASRQTLAMTTAFAMILALSLALPFADRFHAADWSSFDRVYKQWAEIFTLPIPRDATVVGNWGQLNAMRYMQRVENRRPDLQAIGTLYDSAPQTEAARAAFADGRAIFLAPGIAQPIGDYRYAQLGPLLEVRGKPQMQSPAAQKDIAVIPSLTLANYEITTALEPYAPTTSIAPNRTARVTLDWRADGAMKDFLVCVRLYDPDGRAIAQGDEPPIRGLYPAAQWSRGEYVRDVHNLQIPAGTPPGTYQLKLQVLDAETKTPTSNEIALASFAVERATNLTREQIFIAQSFDRTLNYPIALWGCSGCDGTHRVGETIGISLLWYARATISEDLTLQLALVDTAGKSLAIWTRVPITFYPTSQWQPGEVLKAYYDLPLPNNLPGGIYILTAGIAGQSSAPIGKIQIAQ